MDYFWDGTVVTGVLHAVIGARSPARYTVTVGNSASFYGYNLSGAFGAISSSTFRGKTIENVFSGTQALNEFDIQIAIQTNVPQNFFGILEVQDTTGAYRRYTSASASYSVVGDNATWVWDNNNPVWTSTTPESRILVLY